MTNGYWTKQAWVPRFGWTLDSLPFATGLPWRDHVPAEALWELAPVGNAAGCKYVARRVDETCITTPDPGAPYYPYFAPFAGTSSWQGSFELTKYEGNIVPGTGPWFPVLSPNITAGSGWQLDFGCLPPSGADSVTWTVESNTPGVGLHLRCVVTWTDIYVGQAFTMQWDGIVSEVYSVAQAAQDALSIYNATPPLSQCGPEGNWKCFVANDSGAVVMVPHAVGGGAMLDNYASDIDWHYFFSPGLQSGIARAGALWVPGSSGVTQVDSVAATGNRYALDTDIWKFERRYFDQGANFLPLASDVTMPAIYILSLDVDPEAPSSSGGIWKSALTLPHRPF
jgi:hypothetical protein